MRFHFVIQASFIVDTEGWYCVTNGNISFSSLRFCFRSIDSLSVNFISDRQVSFLSKFVGSLCPSSVFLTFECFSSKVVSEEFFRRILKASPLTNPFFNTWRVTPGEMCVQEGFRLFKMCLCIKDRFFLESCASVSTTVSKNTVSVSDVSALNLIV